MGFLLDSTSNLLTEQQRQVLAIRDFRVLWLGSFLSFLGSWVQNIAQGWLVYHLTGDKAKLAMVGFASTIPVFAFTLLMGALADTLDRRKVLIVCQAVFACSALFLAAMCATGNIRYEQIIVIAFINGLASALEMTTRQSIMGRVVPLELVPTALPLQAMTFNLARIIGPAVGGYLAHLFHPQMNYFVNGLSYLALIFAVMSLNADLSPARNHVEPVRDLIMEGIRYTWRNRFLRKLFLLELVLSVFALFYISLLPAYIKDTLHADERGFGGALSSIGIGAVLSLFLLAVFSHKPYKARIVQCAMLLVGLSVVGLALTRSALVASICLTFAGMGSVAQFNTTGALFQLLSPEALRGRVVSMHVWALSGIGPLSLPFFGGLAEIKGLPFTFLLGGGIVVAVSLGSLLFGRTLRDLDGEIARTQRDLTRKSSEVASQTD